MDRLRILVDAGIALSSELSLDALLQRIVETAALLTGAQYAALGVIDKSGLMQLLAAQAAVAIENARLYESSTRWLRQLESLNEIGNALASEFELEPLLALVARDLQELVDARLVLIALPSEGVLRVAAAEGEGSYGVVGMQLDFGGSKAGRVLERGRSERVDSVLDDPEIDQQAARRLGIHSALFVPLVARGRGIGVLIAHDRAGATPVFTDDDLRLTETLAARAAVAVDLTERVSRDAVRRVVAAQELERTRLARELHDETGQALTSILLGLKPLERLATTAESCAAVASVRELVVSTLQDVRRLAVELRPSALDDFGLVPAVERLAETFREQTGMRVDLETSLGEERLRPEVETAFYRIVQEAVTNVAKHADAGQVSILLTRKDNGVAAVVEDDGSGFEERRDEEGLGLVGMRERLALVGGKLRIESTPDSGTTIVAEVPVR